MKRLKSIFLVLVIMLLSLGLASNTYARERAGENDCEHSSRRSRGGRDNSGGRLDYDGRTSGIGKKIRRYCRSRSRWSHWWSWWKNSRRTCR